MSPDFRCKCSRYLEMLTAQVNSLAATLNSDKMTKLLISDGTSMHCE